MPRILNQQNIMELRNELLAMANNLGMLPQVTDRDVRQQFHDITVKLGIS